MRDVNKKLLESRLGKGDGMTEESIIFAWYDIENDVILTSGHLDSLFYGLYRCDWDRFILLGEL